MVGAWVIFYIYGVKKRKMTTEDDLGKKDYQVTVNCRKPPGEPRSIGRQSHSILCSVYHVYKVVDLTSYA